MNIAVRKLSMLEHAIAEKEENAKKEGYATNTVDAELKKRVANLMLKLQTI